MNDLGLGKLIESYQQRDAIHIAVAPVMTTERLSPGDHVGFIAGSVKTVWRGAPNKIGIVDPFLKEVVLPEQRFWMFLYPNTITSLRHEWTHPAFVTQAAPVVKVPDKAASEQWLREFAEQAGLGYDRMLEIVRGYIESGDPWIEHNSEQARDAFDDVDKDVFWKHAEIAAGLKKPGEEHWYSPFSCSC